MHTLIATLQTPYKNVCYPHAGGPNRIEKDILFDEIRDAHSTKSNEQHTLNK